MGWSGPDRWPMPAWRGLRRRTPGALPPATRSRAPRTRETAGSDASWPDRAGLARRAPALHGAWPVPGASGSALGRAGFAKDGVTLVLEQQLFLFQDFDLLVGGVFVMKAVSVILQVGSFKTRGKRIFAMAPLHHHFEMKKWSETQVTVRFWILSILFALLGILTLKIR